MAFRERFKRVFRRSSVASRDGSLREETKKQKTIPRPSTAATAPVSIASAPEIPLPASLKASTPAIAPPKPTKAPAIIPKPTKASDPTPKPAKKNCPFPQPIPKVGNKSKPAKKKTPFPQPIPKVKSKPKAAPSPPEGVSAVRARFAHITPRKPKYDKNGKVKIELYKPHEVPPSKYRGPFDPKHIKALADYSWGAALTERPRSIVSQCSPMTELGPDGKVSLWAGNNASQSKLRTEVSREEDEVVKVEKKVDSPFGSIGQVTGMFDIPTSTSQQGVSEAGKSQTDSEPYNPTSYQSSEMTTGSSAADTSLHSGVGADGDTLATLITNFSADMDADNDDDEDEVDDDDNFLMLTESYMRVFDTPSTPMSVLSPWSSNTGKTPLTEPGMLGVVTEGK